MKFDIIMFFLADFIAAALLTSRKIQDNRGNLIHQPLWKKTLNHTFDVILLLIIIYAWMTVPGDELFKRNLFIKYWITVLAIVGISLTVRIIQKIKRSAEHRKQAEIGFLIPPPSNDDTIFSPETEYLKLVLIDMGKIMAIIWHLVFWISKTFYADYKFFADGYVQITLERFLMCLCLISLTLALHNVCLICIRKEDSEKNELVNQIVKDLKQKNIRV